VTTLYGGFPATHLKSCVAAQRDASISEDHPSRAETQPPSELQYVCLRRNFSNLTMRPSTSTLHVKISQHGATTHVTMPCEASCMTRELYRLPNHLAATIGKIRKHITLTRSLPSLDGGLVRGALEPVSVRPAWRTRRYTLQKWQFREGN
jgi:hypothetical protein